MRPNGLQKLRELSFMPMIRAVAKNVGASPKRIRPIADLIRGKKIEEALDILKFLPSPWARAISKVVKSASSNAENNLMLDSGNLRIVSIAVDGAPVLKRYKLHARGKVGFVRKRSSHIIVVVDEEVN